MEDKVVDVYCHMIMATTGNDICGDGGCNQVTLHLISERNTTNLC